MHFVPTLFLVHNTVSIASAIFSHFYISNRVQGGSRPSECGKIPAEIFRKSVTFGKTYKNQ